MNFCCSLSPTTMNIVLKFMLHYGNWRLKYSLKKFDSLGFVSRVHTAEDITIVIRNKTLQKHRVKMAGYQQIDTSATIAQSILADKIQNKIVRIRVRSHWENGIFVTVYDEVDINKWMISCGYVKPHIQSRFTLCSSKTSNNSSVIASRV